MYALTSSMKGTTGRRFANMVFKKADVKVCRYSSHALDMKLGDDTLNKTMYRTPNLPFQASSIFSVNSCSNVKPRTRNLSTAAASFVGDNTSATTTPVLPVDDSGSSDGVATLIGDVKKETKRETNVSVKINLNGSGVADSNSGIPFLDKMLHKFASYGMFDVHVKAIGDVHVDKRLTNEEVARAIGMALKDAVGDNKEYINRCGSFSATHNKALVNAALDFSGHPHLGFDCYFGDGEGFGFGKLVKPFFESLVNTSGMTLHIQKLSGSKSRHIVMAIFKAFAGALRQATEYDPRRRSLLLDGTLPTSK